MGIVKRGYEVMILRQAQDDSILFHNFTVSVFWDKTKRLDL